MSLNSSRFSIVVPAVVLALSGVACAAPHDDATGAGGAEGAASGHPADPRDGMSAEGLTVDQATSDRAAGRLVRDGITLGFELTRDGEARTARFTSATGEPILESSLRDGVDTSRYFGGKATARGAVNGEVEEKTGDPAVFESLTSSPEAALIPKLKEALLASRRVNEDLFRAPSRGAGEGALTPRALNDGQWQIVTRGNSYGFFSWSFWGTTNVIVGDYMDYWGGFYRASFQAGLAGPEYVAGNGHNIYGRNWWGAWVNINTDHRYVELCGIGDPYCNYREWIWVYAY